ncbi:hypothetical protein RE628_01485 [Paenibacillus sp. D2_2]|uniref:hypothetical protein n=1 Tax=Paenibacillus sp. D2_2 TaxID=3073092 RepID=UPI0028151DDB|nr:hypothetical protein [Paenibacillus sp. D2_2]WMT41291.1 hypothetical protein RE628_01485 [Paenibacillus sp. D2_2]
MGQVLKRISWVFVTIISILLLVIAVSFINHRIQLNREAGLITPPGTMVNVKDHQMHVYAEGSGPRTLVFMSGAGQLRQCLISRACIPGYQIVIESSL